MKREDFLKLNALDRMNYLNEKLKEHEVQNIKKFFKDIIKIDYGSCKTYLNKHNIIYDKNTKQFYHNVDITQNNSNKDDVEIVEEHKENTNLTHNNLNNNNIEIIEEHKENTNQTLINKIDLQMQQNIIDIMQDAEILKQMIEQYKNNTTVLHQKLIIDLPQGNTKHTTMRVNEIILEEFNKFADKNKQYSKIDLVSQALKEFVEKYN